MKKILLFLGILIYVSSFGQEPRRAGQKIYNGLYTVYGTDTIWVQSQDTSALFYSTDTIIDIIPSNGTKTSAIRLFRGASVDSAGLYIYRTNGSYDQINTFLSAGNDNISFMNRYSGRMCIGSTTAGEKLTVVGTMSSTDQTYLGTGPGVTVGIGTTTATETLTVDGNTLTDTLIGAVSLDSIYDKAYGTMGFGDSARVIPMTQNNFAKITNTWSSLYTTGVTSNVTVQGDSIQAPVNGDYEISWDLSYSGANTDHYHIAIFVNNSQITNKGSTHRDMTTNSVGVAAASTILTLSANDWISLRIMNDANDNDATVENGNLTIKKL